MSAGAMHFPSRGRWLLWLIVLLVLGPFLVIFPAALWLGWTMNPVQNFVNSVVDRNPSPPPHRSPT